MKEQERKNYLAKHPENALTPCKTDLMKVMKDKENVPVHASSSGPSSEPQIANPPVLADVSNGNRRVSFAASVGSNNQQPPVTPTRVQPSQTYQTPTAFNYLTAMQSPSTPSFNYAAYHGYGMATPSTNQAWRQSGFAVGSPYAPGFYPYLAAAAPVPMYANSQSFVPSNQYSKIVNSKIVNSKKDNNKRTRGK